MFTAFALILKQYPDIVLILVGDGDERRNLETLVDKLDMRDQVIFTGYISRPQHYLDCMDIFLLSSLSEGTSMTLLEAMSLARPCVVTDAGGNREIIADGVNGYVTRNDDCHAFADAVLRLLKDEEKCGSMGQSSLQRYQQYFSASSMIENYQRLYKDLI